MTLTTASDISVVLSGGQINIDPNKSLGGDPSTTLVRSGLLNNLFDDVLSEESEVGREDYRCIYFFNDGPSPIYNVALWISEDGPEGSTMEIGLEVKDEIQRITLSGSMHSGSMTLSFGSYNITSAFNADLANWAADLQSKLRNIKNVDNKYILPDVVVTAQLAGPTVSIFDIRFADKSGKKQHPEINVVSNNLQTNVSIDISAIQYGAPINTIAPALNVDTTPPGGVSFVAARQNSSLQLPRLDPEDGFPVWIKRTTAPGAAAVERDSFKLRFKAESLT